MVYYSWLSVWYIIFIKFLNVFNQEVCILEMMFYELYNQYEWIEVGVGLGKIWNMKVFIFVLEVSGGYFQWLNVDGNYLNQEGVL